METRKVQLTGGSTYTVSIPKQWATEHDIEAGERLHLFPHADGSLVFRSDPHAAGEETTTEIDVADLSEGDLRRVLKALYTVGLDRIALTDSTGLTPKRRRVITREASNLVGFETIEETDTYVTIRSLLSAEDVSIRRTVIQLQFVALSMYREAIGALLETDTERAGYVTDRDDEADRLFGLVTRYFQRSLSDMGEVSRLGVDRPAVFEYYTTARQFERIADHAERIATTVPRFEDTPLDPIVEAITDVAATAQSIIEDAASVLLGRGAVEQAYSALSRRDDLSEEIEDLDRRLYVEKTPAAYLLGSVLDSVERTADYGANIAETAVRTTVRTEDSRR